MHVHLYRRMKFSPDQRNSMAALWGTWERRRRSLSASLQSAVTQLRSLPQTLHLPVDAVTHISDLASGRVSRPSVLAFDATAPAVAVAAAAAAASGGYAAAAAAAAAAVAVTVPQLVGASPEAAAAAAGALQCMEAVHDADAEVFVTTVSVSMHPGVLLSTEQHLRLISAHLGARTAPADFLALCQLASSQCHRAKLFGKVAF